MRASRAAWAFLKAIRPHANWSRARWFSSFFDLAANPTERRFFNRAFFEYIEVDTEEISGHPLAVAVRVGRRAGERCVADRDGRARRRQARDRHRSIHQVHRGRTGIGDGRRPIGPGRVDGDCGRDAAQRGDVVSCTVTGNVPDEWLPAASVAVHVTVVVPSGNVEPDAGEQTYVTAPFTRSDAEYETAAPGAPVASAVIADGRLRAGVVALPTESSTLSVRKGRCTNNATLLTCLHHG